MTSRRAPLANVPNAINSPLRSNALLSGKRTRAQAGDQREVIYGQPPTKRQAIEVTYNDDENVDPRRRNGIAAIAQDKLEEPLGRRNAQSQPTTLEKKLAAAREKKPAAPQQRVDRENHRQWQRHYRRQFPKFVFYFDGVPEDIQHKAMRQIHALNGKVEKFFAKGVTHVVTTRSIPAEQSSTDPDEAKDEQPPSKSIIQPALAQDQRRSTNLLEATLQRRSQQHATANQPSLEQRKPQIQGADVLTRARGMEIRIWALEKLSRVLNGILNTDTGDESQDAQGYTSTQRVSEKPAQDADLEQLLRHEKINGPADRDMTVATQDMVVLRGCYIYVHDMDEKTKPVLVRDYARPANKDLGKWPQFRVSSSGRCPFIEDPAQIKRQRDLEREAQAYAQEDAVQRRTRHGSALAAAPDHILVEREANLRRSPRKSAQVKASLDRPMIPPPGRRVSSAEMPSLFGSAQAGLRGAPRMVGGEPVASGVQRSNITSAIRSQIVSSAAISSTAPGLNRRVGDTKEVSLLKRKVFASNNSMPSSHVNEIRGAINDSQDPPPRAAKRKAQETLGVVLEGSIAAKHAQAKLTAFKKEKVVLKEPKPGYCENCRDKYDDFDDHIASRKHRKFATTAENWKDLDNLLRQLKREHKRLDA